MQDKRKGKANKIDIVVSKRLKSKRLMLGFSQGDIAKVVGVSIQQVQKYENAKNRISSGKLFAIAKFLKIPITYFYEQDDGSEVIAECDAENESTISETEIISLIRAFKEIKNLQTRKKIIDLIKTML